MRLSVAMCTYNGVSYLAAQLASIAAQARAPDELVVCDDHSTDGTVSLLEVFAARAPFPTRVRVNSRNIGATANFSQAIRECRGDVIALCDQDDVWAASKLARLEATFASPRVGLVFSDAELIDHEGRPLGLRLWDVTGFTRGKRRRARVGGLFEVQLAHGVVTGTTMAFRATYRERVLPIPPDWIHDAWIALLLAALAEVSLVDEPLVQYRVHPRQTVGLGGSGHPPTALERLAGGHQRARALLIAFRGFRNDPAGYSAGISRTCAAVAAQLGEARDRLAPHESARMLASLTAKLNHVRARATLPERRLARAGTVARELLTGRYHRYSLGSLSAARDLFL